MLAKSILAAAFAVMIAAAVYFNPYRERSLLATRPPEGPHIKLMTWNLGYAGSESDSRAHASDMAAVARVIAAERPDVVALQELAGADQLDILAAMLHHGYKGALASRGNSDRLEGILVSSDDAAFQDVPAAGKYCLAVTFTKPGASRPVVLVSVHADAYSAAKRRVFTGDLVDWLTADSKDAIPFIAGDFNFELDTDKQENLYSDNLKNDSESYSYLLRSFRDLGRDAGFTTFNDRRIDYIFGPPEAVLFRRSEVLNTVAIGHMDHWPLVVEVAI